LEHRNERCISRRVDLRRNPRRVVLEPDALHGTPPDGRQIPRPGWSDLCKRVGSRWLLASAASAPLPKFVRHDKNLLKRTREARGALASFMLLTSLKFLNELAAHAAANFPARWRTS